MHCLTHRRETMIGELIDSCNLLDDLLRKTRQGVEFYTKLEANIERVLQRAVSVCKTQAEEREQITARLKPKGRRRGALSFASFE